MNMKKWLGDVVAAPRKKAMPVLSFPGIQLTGASVPDMIGNSDVQARAIKAVADRCDMLAAVGPMDLSLEAECFGSSIRFSDDEVPTVVGGIISTMEQAQALAVPAVGAGRTGIYIEAIGKALGLVTDRPVLAGVIGPFSLAGRLMDVSEAMIYCYDDPDMVHAVLEKATVFITAYAKAYKAVGANGVIMAEPLAGLLSPELAEEFSAPYVKRIVDAVQDDGFIVVYHNCGGSTIRSIDSILSTGASMFHFGNAISMSEMMAHIPAGTIAMGNVNPAVEMHSGTPESVREVTSGLLRECGGYPNYVPSTGCDVPPKSPWENIDAFFAAVEEYYSENLTDLAVS